ncbi:hypothetical protein CCAND38_490012 [Capnocytophaga canis]|uniref:Uncharacterized protein n=1 Tax=Capnocytophaga canis TaxID=1848903 RepID=A0A0B7I796_9FLAO|nr:hypothetical protein CCAND38_490012 [Capnocytophaga canis]
MKYISTWFFIFLKINKKENNGCRYSTYNGFYFDSENKTLTYCWGSDLQDLFGGYAYLFEIQKTFGSSSAYSFGS